MSDGDISKATGRSKKSSKDAIGKRRRLPAAERRQQIIEAAERVFVRSGFQGARTREVAEEAGVNEATVFKHFANKEELFTAAVIEPLKELMSGQQASSHIFSETANFEARRQISKESNHRQLIAMVDVFPLLMTALFSDEDMGRQFYRDHLGPWLDQAMEASRVAVPDWDREDFDPGLLGFLGFGMHLGIAMDAHFRGTNFDFQRLSGNIADFYMLGMFGVPPKE